MSYGSSVPEAIDALFTLLDARSGLDHVAVTSEYPTDPSALRGDTGLNEAVFLGRQGGAAITASASFPVLGHRFVDETYQLWVTCQALKDTSSGTQIEARQRAYELAAEVIGTVLADPTLGLTDTSTRSAFEIGGRLTSGPYDLEDGGGYLASGGHGWRVSVGLNCSARITLT